MHAYLDSIINPTKNYDEEVYIIEKELLQMDKPNVWNIYTPGNMERSLEVDFQKFALSVTEDMGSDLTGVSTFSFYAKVELLKEQKNSK